MKTKFLRPFEAMLVLSASFFFMVCLFVPVAIHLELNARSEIANLRSPVFTETRENANYAFRIDDTFIDSKLVGILEIEPIVESETLPPRGLSTWIAPGTIAISAAAQPYIETLETQFGPVQQIIDSSAVLDDELLVYFRPSDRESFLKLAESSSGVYYASEMAQKGVSGVTFGDITYEYWGKLLLPLAFLTLILPLVINLWITRTAINEYLAKDRFILQSIGASWGKLFWHSLRKISVLAVLGYLCAIVVEVLLVVARIPLPFTRFSLNPDVYWENILPISAIYFIGGIIVLLYLTWPQVKVSHRTRNRKRRINAQVSLVLYSLGIIATIIYTVFWVKFSERTLIPIFLGIVFLFILGLRGVLIAVSTSLASILIKKKHDSLETIFGNWVINHPYRATRVGVFSGVFLCIGVLLMAFFALVAPAQVTSEKYFGNIQIVQTEVLCTEKFAECIADAAEKVQAQNPEAAIVVGSHGEGLAKITSGNLQEPVLAELINKELVPKYGPLSDLINQDINWRLVFTISDSSKDLLSSVQSIDFNQDLKPLSMIYEEDSQGVAKIYQHQAKWLTLMTTLSFVYALVSIWVQFSRESNLQAREFASIAALTGKIDLLVRGICLRNLCVNILSGIISLGTGTFIARQILLPFGGFMPWSFMCVVGMIYLIFITLQEIFTWYLMRIYAKSWKPGKGEG
ncbi:MAG: hypothetical protein SPG61_01950 [Arcanobacterium sp.]|nr:hypothetical protein [Arcanobacterium sp.]